MLSTLSYRVSIKLDLMVKEVCRVVSGGASGEGVRKEVGAGPAPRGLWVSVVLSPLLPSYLHPGAFAAHSQAVVCVV